MSKYKTVTAKCKEMSAAAHCKQLSYLFYGHFVPYQRGKQKCYQKKLLSATQRVMNISLQGTEWEDPQAPSQNQSSHSAHTLQQRLHS
jgi:hypothetical protein